MADEFIFTNNANSTLAVGITPSTTVIQVATGEGTLFPAPVAGERAALTLVDTVLGTLEIVELTTRSGDLMTVVRGAENTLALTFTTGATVSHRMTAGTLDWLKTLSDPILGGFVRLAPAAGTSQVIDSGDVDDIPLTIRGIAAQVANLQEWRNSADLVKVSIAPDGTVVAADLIQALRLRTTQAGSEAVPSVLVGGTVHGFRIFGVRFAVVVNNTDSAIFEDELVTVGALDDLSVVTKRIGDLIYFPIGGGAMDGPLELDYDSPAFDLVDDQAPAFPGFNRIRWINGTQSMRLELRSNAGAHLADLVVVPYAVGGATGYQIYIDGTLAANVAAVGSASPAPTTIITREKGDARYADIAHLSDMGNPHDVIASQVDAVGALGPNVQSQLDALDAQPAGGVQTVFGRIDDVVAADGDYTGALVIYTPTGGLTTTRVQAALDEIIAIVNALPVGGVQTVFGRSGAVSADEADYSGFYILVSAKATKLQAQGGTENSQYMTSLRTGEARQALFHVRDEKPNGVGGGSFNSGDWRTRTLNTEATNQIAGASLASDQFTLPIGTYFCEAVAPVKKVVTSKLRLRNITAGTDQIIGSNTSSPVSSDSGGSVNSLMGQFTITEETVFELQHRSSNSDSNGFGNSAGFGVIEVYAEVAIWKIG
jgi:hypothetical protein